MKIIKASATIEGAMSKDWSEFIIQLRSLTKETEECLLDRNTSAAFEKSKELLNTVIDLQIFLKPPTMRIK